MSVHLTRMVVAALAAAFLVGCAPAQDREVRAVAVRFYAASAVGDPGTACDLLAPKTKSELEQSAAKPCVEALPQQDVPKVDRPLRVRVFGSQAEVTWSGETTFLARFQGGWKVMAAVCTPQSGRPYDCAISGG
jgi:hypothetical protein